MNNNLYRTSRVTATSKQVVLLGMRNFYSRLPVSIPTFCSGIAVVLMVTYVGLIAVVMSYAAMTIEFSQSVRNDEAVVATLEAQYLSTVARITTSDYTTAGYARPLTKVFVPAKSATALR